MSPPITASSTSSSFSTFSPTPTVDPLTNYLHSLMKQRVAVICSSLGWQSMHGSCLQILVDLMARYMKNLGIEMQRRAECCNRTEANLFDVQRVFAEVGITMKELEEYVENFDAKELAGKCPIVQFPAPADNNLNFLKPGSREVLHRKVHINEYFPPMYPELEEEPESTAASGVVHDPTAAVSPRSGIDERYHSAVESRDQDVKRESRGGSSSDGGGFLEPTPPTQLDPQDAKKELSMTTADGSSSDIISHLRDIPSVMMTSAGFISPAREGKLPESRTPHGGAAAAAAAALREEREEEMRSLQKLQKKAMLAEEEHRRVVLSGPGQKQEDTLTMAAPSASASAALSAGPGSGSSPENRKKLAIFQKKSGGVAPKVVKKQVFSTKPTAEGAKVTPSTSAVKKSAKAATSKASSVGSSATKLAPTKVTSAPPVTTGQQAQRKKRGKAPIPISAEIVPDSPPSSPSPPPSHPTTPPPVGLEEDISLTLPPPPPAQSPKVGAIAPASSSGAGDNPLIPRAANFYGFDIGAGTSAAVDKKQRNEKIKMKEKKKKNKKDKLRDKKKKKEKSERLPSPAAEATPAPSTSSETPKSSSTSGVPKITFKGIGNETPKEESAEKKVVIKPVVPPSSSSKGEKKRRQIGAGATEDGDAFQMMFKEPIKIDRPTARTVEQKKGRKRQISGGKNASSVVPQSQTAKRRKTYEPEPSVAPPSRGTNAVTVTPPNRRQRTSTSAENNDDSSGGKDGSGGGITVTQPVGHYVDEDGKEIWICPACGEQYNHLPMICCDRCDEWYHWMCVGISREPDESQDWYCMRCVSEIKKETSGGKKNIKEKRKR